MLQYSGGAEPLMRRRPSDRNDGRTRTCLRSREERVLVLAPTGRDAVLACQLLTSMEVQGFACASAAELFEEIEAGAGAVILADEALHPATSDGLLRGSRDSPPGRTCR